MSPTKKVAAARQLLKADYEEGSLSEEERTKLTILFASDAAAVDAYLSESDAYFRGSISRHLLQRCD
jgi:hypothetical protein